jgi:hypothetical protein
VTGFSHSHSLLAWLLLLSTQRLLFTIFENRHDFKTHNKKCTSLSFFLFFLPSPYLKLYCRLFHEIEKVIKAELQGRATAVAQGVRELTGIISLVPNKFDCIDDKV